MRYPNPISDYSTSSWLFARWIKSEWSVRECFLLQISNAQFTHTQLCQLDMQWSFLQGAEWTRCDILLEGHELVWESAGSTECICSQCCGVWRDTSKYHQSTSRAALWSGELIRSLPWLCLLLAARPTQPDKTASFCQINTLIARTAMNTTLAFVKIKYCTKQGAQEQTAHSGGLDRP